MVRNKFLYVVCAVLVVAAMVVGAFFGTARVSASPNFAVTPVSYTASGGDGAVGLVDWMTARTLIADTTVCKDLREYKAVDLEYVIDQGTTNTTTIKLRNTNLPGTAHLVDDATIVSGNAADATGMVEYALHGVQTCVFVDLANNNPIVITLVGKLMK